MNSLFLVPASPMATASIKFSITLVFGITDDRLVKVNKPKLAEETKRKPHLLGLRVRPVEDDGLWREAEHAKSQTSTAACRRFRNRYG